MIDKKEKQNKERSEGFDMLNYSLTEEPKGKQEATEKETDEASLKKNLSKPKTFTTPRAQAQRFRGKKAFEGMERTNTPRDKHIKEEKSKAEKEGTELVIRDYMKADKKLTETDLEAFRWGLITTLYNESYAYGNQDLNTGRTRERSKEYSAPGIDRFSARVEVSLNEFCKNAYGCSAPDEKQRAAQYSAFWAAANSSIVDIDNNERTESSPMLLVRKETHIKATRELILTLELHPIFSKQIYQNKEKEKVKGFIVYKSDILQKLNEYLSEKGEYLRAEHYRLINLLSLRDKRNEYIVRTIASLLEELGLLEAYKTHKDRTEEKLLSLFEAVKAAGLVRDFQVERKVSPNAKRGKADIEKTFFYFPKPQPEEEEEKEG